jgi:hypothetical protein
MAAWRGQCRGGLIHDIGTNIYPMKTRDEAVVPWPYWAKRRCRLMLSTHACETNDRVEGEARRPCGSCRAFGEPTISRCGTFGTSNLENLANSSVNFCSRYAGMARYGPNRGTSLPSVSAARYTLIWRIQLWASQGWIRNRRYWVPSWRMFVSGWMDGTR